jgi:3-methyladenine DNA glycosylase AlkD
MTQLLNAKRDLQKLRNPERAEFLKRFFKTGKGEYAAGDDLLGISVPNTREIAKKHRELSLEDAAKLLQSPYHEERLMSLFILTDKFEKATEAEKGKIVKIYLKLAAKYVNNWDLVDSSAQYILGKYLLNRPRTIIYKLARSKNLWEKRIAIISTAHFIRNEDFLDTFKVAEILLNDKHDLIHKAVGWMLREVGNKDQAIEVEFLNQHASHMPRTMLRYAIEKFPEKLRLKFLRQKYENMV